MALDTQVIMKSLSPKLTSKALQAFDRATGIVAGACWGGAILMMAFAAYTMTISISAKHAAENATAAEPELPKIVRKNIEPRVAQGVVERLQHDFPDVIFSLQNNQILTVTAIEGTKFRQWLTSLSYIDTISPEYHWNIQFFCVGKCRGNELMRATLTAERVSFEAPPPK